MKKMIITFSDIKGTVYFKFISQSQAGNQAYYVGILKRLRETMYRKCLKFGPTIGFSITIMPQLTRRYLSSSFWQKKKNLLLKWKAHPLRRI
jgi:hypothetical protein